MKGDAIACPRISGMITPTSNMILSELRRLKLLAEAAVRRIETAVRVRETPPEHLAPLLIAAGMSEFQVQVALAGQASRLVFGPFVLLDKLGEGGMGTVYRVLHVKLGRVEALKVLRSDKLNSRTLAKRFLREIELSASLEHPHVVRAFDAGEIGQQLYLATEYVHGCDLATFVRARGPLSVANACLVVYHAALALQHVHEKGLVHRDLKPSNLIRDHATGIVKVLDLGLSGFNRSMLEPGRGATLTRDGVLLGTPDYMAPEQVQNPHAVDIRADLYSLGCTFFFLLTGQPPYGGTPVERIYAHGFAPIPQLVLPAGQTLPFGLADIITRLMEKKPIDRFQTPRELIDALLAIRPGAAKNGNAAGCLIDHPTPIPMEGLPDRQFEHLLSKSGSTEMLLPPEPAPAQLRRFPRWLIGLIVLLLFGLGFLSAALYFTGIAKE